MPSVTRSASATVATQDCKIVRLVSDFSIAGLIAPRARCAARMLFTGKENKKKQQKQDSILVSHFQEDREDRKLSLNESPEQGCCSEAARKNEARNPEGYQSSRESSATNSRRNYSARAIDTNAETAWKSDGVECGGRLPHFMRDCTSRRILLFPRSSEEGARTLRMQLTAERAHIPPPPRNGIQFEILIRPGATPIEF